MKKVYVHKDEEACIVLSKDHHNGVVVQLAIYVESLYKGPEGEMLSSRNTKVIYEGVVPLTTTDFKETVAKIIKQAQAKLVEIQQAHVILDGLLNDYYSQNRELNEPAIQQ